MYYAGPFVGKYYLVVINAYSKWLEVFCVSYIASKFTIQKQKECFTCYRIPTCVVSVFDNATNFTSSDFKQFLKSYCIKNVGAAPYHSDSNQSE